MATIDTSFRVSFKQFGSNRSKLKNLGKNFIANKISAAGVSYIVKENTRLRRVLWLVCVTSCLSFMGYMTVKVIAEYLRYPKMLIQEDFIVSRLRFPAVTVCSLNPISERYISETSLKKHVELLKLLYKTPSLEPRRDLKKSCMDKPLCKWSWFLESCECVESPCLTEFCLPSNDSHCMCSSAICKNDKFVCERIKASAPWSRSLCICDAAVKYISIEEGHLNKSEELEDILSLIDNEDVRNMVQLIWNSKTFDLSDVEEGLMPTLDDIYDYGITFESLVASCSFEKVHCHQDNFSILYHPKYGKCYMFNYVGGKNLDSVKPLDTNNYGSNSGLRLLLRVKDQEDSDLIRGETGARIVLHDPYAIPFVAEYGIDVRPMDVTAIAVSVSTMTRLKAPWGNCVDEGRHGNKREPYSVLGCEKECGIKYMTRKCNCTTRHLMHGSVLTKNKTQYVLCDLNNDTQKECVETVIQNFDNRVIDCNCKPPCQEITYKYTVTSSEMKQEFYNMIKAIRTMTVSPQRTLTYYNTTDQKSMIGVKVYYNTIQMSKQKEVQSYSWETLIANIGGNLGFFMGLTLITFLEIVEFLWDVVSVLCKPAEQNKKSIFKHFTEKMERKVQQEKLDLKCENEVISSKIKLCPVDKMEITIHHL